MPAVQAAYPITHIPAVAGEIANSEPHLVVTGVAQMVIALGVPVVQGTTDDGVKAAAAGLAYVGISVASATLTGVDTAAVDRYQITDLVGILKRGVIWVITSVNVAKNDLVFFVPATGAWTNVPTANTQVPNATWDMIQAAGGFATIRIAA